MKKMKTKKMIKKLKQKLKGHDILIKFLSTEMFDLRERFDNYVISNEIRKSVVGTPSNLLKDKKPTATESYIDFFGD